MFGAPASEPASATPGNNDNGAAQLEQLQVTVADLLPDLKLIARNRLQRSAARVEAMLDEAAGQRQPLEVVLAEIRGLVIRGVMQSTLDDMVDDMMAMASARAGA